MPITGTDELITELRAWAATSNTNIRAAVDLLIDHDFWLANGAFVRTAVVDKRIDSDVDGAYIKWHTARQAFDAGMFIGPNTTQMAVLDFAIDLGTDRFRLNNMGKWHLRRMAQAMADATS